MTRYYSLSLMLVLALGQQLHTCEGTSYALPSGSSNPIPVVFSPSGTTVSIFNVSSGILSGGISYALPSGSTGPRDGAFSPDGSFFATANNSSADVTIFNVSAGVLSGGTSYALPSGSTNPLSVAFSPNGAYLAVANENSNNVTIFTVSSGVLSAGTSYALPSGSTSPVTIAFSPSGSYLATANADSADVTIFSIASGVLNGGTSYSLPPGSTYPYSAIFSPDGAYLATANYGSGTSDSGAGVTIFQVSSGVLNNGISYLLPSGSTKPFSIAFSPNGSLLATANFGSNDVTVFTAACLGIAPSPTTNPPATTSGVTTTIPPTTVPTGCVPPIPPAPSTLCNGTNWIIANSITVSGLQASDQAPLVVLGSLTLAPNCTVTVDLDETGATPIVVQNTAQISPN